MEEQVKEFKKKTELYTKANNIKLFILEMIILQKFIR